ncbi:hypothetical protein BDZ94DRAFT_1264621 [Collybia nuda]|uniref:DUF6534 domain-containing protein n=1 Tax=Collybia nuda TaxID=64659 RepID=A0A9P5Y3Z4_9AGAR|nr:hypothetical protein BDZ94DRAFT_1264621 [Collybia nuda]
MLKGLVYGLLLVETAQSILIAHDIFTIFATGFGNLAAVQNPQLTWLDGPILAAVVSCTVQIYFARQIYVLSGSKMAGIMIILLALMQGIGAIVSGVKALQLHDLTVLQARAHTSITIWLVGSAICDIIIAAFLVYFLWRRASSFKATQALVTKIMRLTIETGSLTAAVAIIDVALFLAFPEHNFHVAPALILGKLYSNTLVTTLNSRLAIVNGRNDTSSNVVNSYHLGSSGQIPVEKTHRMRIPGVASRLRKNETAVAVSIEREIWTNDIPMDRMDSHEINRSKIRNVEELV